MALDRAIRCGNDTSESVYDTRGLCLSERMVINYGNIQWTLSLKG